jgi:hypothetical protein
MVLQCRIVSTELSYLINEFILMTIVYFEVFAVFIFAYGYHYHHHQYYYYYYYYYYLRKLRGPKFLADVPWQKDGMQLMSLLHFSTTNEQLVPLLHL